MEPQRSLERLSGSLVAAQSHSSSSLQAPPAFSRSSASENVFVPSTSYLAVALAALCFVGDSLIYESLQTARSVRGFDPYSLEGSNLTTQQIEHIFVLRHVPDKEVGRWLSLARTSNYAGHVQAPATLDGTLTQIFERTYHTDKIWLCSVCSTQRSFSGRDSWWKHEKEHEDTYLCPFDGPQQWSAASAQETDTSRNSSCSSFYKRREFMVKHFMKHHGVDTKINAQEIADENLHLSNKRFWSCGFCIHLLDSHKDRLLHVAQHFVDGATRDQWQATREIEGLLGQPLVKDAWAQRMQSSHTRDISWEGSPAATVFQLRHLLQLGAPNMPSAEYLAGAAFAASNLSPDTAPSNLICATPIGYRGDDGGMTVDPSRLGLGDPFDDQQFPTDATDDDNLDCTSEDFDDYD